MSEKSDKLRAMLKKEKERRIKLNNRIEILERRMCRLRKFSTSTLSLWVWHSTCRHPSALMPTMR